MTHRRLIGFALTAMFVCCGGCSKGGPELADVYGVVTVDGEPLQGFTVTFVPQEPGGSTSSSVIDQEGKFRLMFTRSRPGAMVGEHRVLLEAAPKDERAARPIKLPRRLTNGSQVTAVVQPGRNDIELKLSTSENATR